MTVFDQSEGDSTSRRRFISGVMLTALAAPAMAQEARVKHPSDSTSPDNEWMDSLKGRHRTVFDIAAHRNGKPLAQARNFLNAWRDAFHAKPHDVNLVLGFHGDAIPIVLDDASWARFDLAAQYDVGSAEKHAKENVFLARHAAAHGLVAVDHAIDTLRDRGAIALVCANTIAGATTKLSAAGFGEPAVVHDAIVAGLLPGVIVVPSMVVTLSQLQERHISYVKIA